jgi:hypothetical protein
MPKKGPPRCKLGHDAWEMVRETESRAHIRCTLCGEERGTRCMGRFRKHIKRPETPPPQASEPL